MTDQDRELIATLLAAQVLTLAKAIAAEKRANGSGSTSHYVPEAVALISQERGQILALLQQTL